MPDLIASVSPAICHRLLTPNNFSTIIVSNDGEVRLAKCKSAGWEQSTASNQKE